MAKKRRLKTLRTGIKPARSPVRVYRPPQEQRYSLELQARKALYRGPDWKRLRIRHLRRFPYCVKCGEKANIVDHLLGHDDGQALAIMRATGIAGELNWRERFFTGPFISLCQPCHSVKSKAETAGRLREWIQEWSASESH